MFIKNQWYAAGWEGEISDKPLARSFLGEPVVLFRTSTGIGALADRCPHRGVPLHLGKVVGDALQCAYHGFEFERGGQCIKIPGQEMVPRNACVRSYPIITKYTIVWIWMGDPEAADESLIPDYSPLVDPEWRGKGTYIHVKANYRLIVENLLDLTHLAFVHPTTIGNNAVVENADVEFSTNGDNVEVVRWMLDVPAPPTYVKAAGFTTNIDRWQKIYFEPPGFIKLDTGATEAGTGAPEGKRNGGMRMWNLNLITPETENTSHYFWAQCHDFQLDDPSVTATVFEQVQIAFLEDKVIFEAQQKALDNAPDDLRELSVRGDTGGLAARRILTRLTQSENAAE